VVFTTVLTVHIAEYAKWGDPRTITHISTNQKVIALTIDDGPHPVTTPEILSVLKEKKVDATFFILGQNGQKRPDIVAQEIADGHEVAVHAYHHKPLTQLDIIHIMEELEKTENLITMVSPEKPALFRPPGGIYNDAVIAAAQEKKYSIILWNIDTLDWTRPAVNSIVHTVLNNISPGSIILFHDGQYPLPTAKALAVIIDRLSEQGYRFATVSEMLRFHEIRPTYRHH